MERKKECREVADFHARKSLRHTGTHSHSEAHATR